MNDTLKRRTRTETRADKKYIVRKGTTRVYLSLVSFTFLYTNIVHHRHHPSGLLCINSKLSLFLFCVSQQTSHWEEARWRDEEEELRRNEEREKEKKKSIALEPASALP